MQRDSHTESRPDLGLQEVSGQKKEITSSKKLAKLERREEKEEGKESSHTENQTAQALGFHMYDHPF